METPCRGKSEASSEVPGSGLCYSASCQRTSRSIVQRRPVVWSLSAVAVPAASRVMACKGRLGSAQMHDAGNASAAAAGQESRRTPGKINPGMGARNGCAEQYVAKKRALSTDDRCTKCNDKNVDSRCAERGLTLCWDCR